MDVRFSFFVISFVIIAISLCWGIVFLGLINLKKKPSDKTALRMLCTSHLFFVLIKGVELYILWRFPVFELVRLARITALTVTMVHLFCFSCIYIQLLELPVNKKVMPRIVLPILIVSVVIPVVIWVILPDETRPVVSIIFTLIFIISLLIYNYFLLKLLRKKMKNSGNFFSTGEFAYLSWLRNSHFVSIIYVSLISVYCFILNEMLLNAIMLISLFLGTYTSYNYIIYLAKSKMRFDEKRINKHLITKHESQLSIPITEMIENALKIWVADRKFQEEGITIEDVATYIGTNRNYVSSYINSVYKKTFPQWINELRIAEGISILRQNREISITHLAAQLGYSDKSHFTKQFKQLTGILPSTWRDENMSHR